MTTKPYFALILAAFISEPTLATELINCTKTSPDQTSSLSVFETEEGYAYQISECSHRTCATSSGPINRTMTPDNPSMVFKSNDVSIIHLFGTYVVTGGRTGNMSFGDDHCQFHRGDDFVVAAESSRMRTSSPCEYADLEALAEQGALTRAQTQCQGEALQIGEFEYDRSCNKAHETVQARSIFRCI